MGLNSVPTFGMDNSVSRSYKRNKNSREGKLTVKKSSHCRKLSHVQYVLVFHSPKKIAGGKDVLFRGYIYNVSYFHIIIFLYTTAIFPE